jgi:transposase
VCPSAITSPLPSFRKKTPWAQWPTDKKEDIARQALNGATYRQLSNGVAADQFPPESTVRTWATAVQARGCLSRVGRPSHLSEPEEQHLLSVLRFMRKRGAPVDAEFLVMMAKKCVARCRNISITQVPDYSRHWVKSFRRRMKISKLRKSSTDRAPTTAAHTIADNDWRAALLAVMAAPASYGIQGTSGTIPDGLVTAMDETPLLYCPGIRGTYVEGDGDDRKQVYVVCAREKRQVTASPWTTKSGELLGMQIIWRGLTPACHPRLTSPSHVSMYHTHAKKKCQTR